MRFLADLVTQLAFASQPYRPAAPANRTPITRLRRLEDGTYVKENVR